MSDGTIPSSADDNHVYDGIEELDNDLPRWWRWMFYISIAWALWYPLYYHDGHRLGETRLAAEQVAAAEERAKHETGPVSEEILRSLSHNPDRIARGHDLFSRNGCIVCHGPDGAGLVGPNLRDDYWIHGSSLTDIAGVIANGAANGAMPAQKAMLGGDEISNIAIWIAEQSRTGNKAGKAPDPTREKLAPVDY